MTFMDLMLIAFSFIGAYTIADLTIKWWDARSKVRQKQRDDDIVARFNKVTEPTVQVRPRGQSPPPFGAVWSGKPETKTDRWIKMKDDGAVEEILRQDSDGQYFLFGRHVTKDECIKGLAGYIVAEHS